MTREELQSMTKAAILDYAKAQGFILTIGYWKPMLKARIINHVLYSQEIGVNGYGKEK